MKPMKSGLAHLQLFTTKRLINCTVSHRQLVSVITSCSYVTGSIHKVQETSVTLGWTAAGLSHSRICTHQAMTEGDVNEYYMLVVLLINTEYFTSVFIKLSAL